MGASGSADPGPPLRRPLAVAPVGTASANYRLSRYANPEYDAILDQMAPLGSDDPRFQELGAQLMEIYWRDQINVPIIQWLHRIAYNQHYWTNWPTADNVLYGQPGGWWAHTGMLVALQLEATGADAVTATGWPNFS